MTTRLPSGMPMNATVALLRRWPARQPPPFLPLTGIVFVGFVFDAVL